MKFINLIILFAFTFLIVACEQSKKGSWTKSDKDKCVSDGVDEMKTDENFKMMKSLFKIDDRSFAKCMCDNLEKTYSSYDEANKKVNKELDEAKATELFKNCLGPEFQELFKEME